MGMRSTRLTVSDGAPPFKYGNGAGVNAAVDALAASAAAVNAAVLAREASTVLTFGTAPYDRIE